MTTPAPNISILPSPADAAEAVALIEELEAELAPLYPSESRHGYSVQKLLREGVAFFVAWLDGEAVGCGGIQLYGCEYGELKRMYVRPAHRGRSVARHIIAVLEDHARAHGVQLVRLETGIHQTDAIRLYVRCGYARIDPFGEYRPDPLSVFFEKRLD